MKTHRCKGSLEHCISIRYCKKIPELSIPDDYNAWRLFRVEEDYDYNTKYLKHVTEIQYCPFCGKRLEKESL